MSLSLDCHCIDDDISVVSEISICEGGMGVELQLPLKLMILVLHQLKQDFSLENKKALMTKVVISPKQMRVIVS